MADYSHTIDRWDDVTGEKLVEQIAAVGDYLVAWRLTGRQVGKKDALATGRGSSSRVGRISRSIETVLRADRTIRLTAIELSIRLATMRLTTIRLKTMRPRVLPLR